MVVDAALQRDDESTHQVGRVDDVRVPVAGHVVVRENYAACKRLKCVSNCCQVSPN